MKFLIISGMSGAGKSRVAAILEDMDFYCVDNMPVVLIPKFAELCLATRGRYERVALVTDVRGRNSFDELFRALDDMKAMGCDYEILFMEASTDALINRYKETRRKHPLDPDGKNIEAAVSREREILLSVREKADYIIDTSSLHTSKLQLELFRLFAVEGDDRLLRVNVLSFGFKYGIPTDADLVFDVRFLPNPFYVGELRSLCGLDKPVRDYVFSYQQTTQFMELLKKMMDFLLPMYIEEGKRSLLVAIGCTGGKHRSVAIARELAEHMKELGYKAEDNHRDIDKA